MPTSPHILIASGNARRMIANLKAVLDQTGLLALEAELRRNVASLFALGQHHLDFANATAQTHWRQRVSRAYYGAYNIRRAVMLELDGTYATDVSDHKKVESLPQNFPDRETYVRRLKDLRDDRNMADYDHDAAEADLVVGQNDAIALGKKLAADARQYLVARGVPL